MDRILLNLALLMAVAWGPWWLTLGVIVASVCIVHNMYEVAVYALLADALYSAPGAGLWSFPLWNTLCALIILACSSIAREFVRNYA